MSAVVNECLLYFFAVVSVCDVLSHTFSGGLKCCCCLPPKDGTAQRQSKDAYASVLLSRCGMGASPRMLLVVKSAFR